MEIYLIRHTQPDIGKGICYGQSDICLAGSFDLEWNGIRGELPAEIDMIYSSTLQRCTLLAAKIAAFYNAPVVKDPRLMELHFGDWEMKRWDDLDQAALKLWMDNYLEKRCPNGESYHDLRLRLLSFLHELRGDKGRKLIVTHGGIIKCFHGMVKGTDGMELEIGYGEIYRYSGNLSIVDRGEVL